LPEEDVKEKILAAAESKLYQRQVFKIKTLKGVGTEERKPSRKENGFLSIERMPNNLFCLVFRSFMG
jgi:hypothetical protein